MRRFQKAGSHFYLNGIRFRVFGDQTEDYTRQMILESQLALQKLKDRSDPSLELINYENPPYFRVRRYFGQDEIFIYPEVIKKAKGIELEEILKEKKEERKVEYLPAFEVYDDSDQKIGYIVCEGGSFEPPYSLLLTDNIIAADATKEETIAVHELGIITVDPFYFPNWKDKYADSYGEQESRPFDEDVLLDKEVARSSLATQDSTKTIIYEDVACTFEELVIVDDDWVDTETDRDAGWQNMTMYWLPYYSGDPSGVSGNSFWKCWGAFGGLNTYDGYNHWDAPYQYCHVTNPDWYDDGVRAISTLDKILNTKYSSGSDRDDFVGSYLDMTDVAWYWGLYLYGTMPYQGDAGGEEICKELCHDAVFYNGQYAYWAYSTLYPDVPYGGWCKSYGCWDYMYSLALAVYNGWDFYDDICPSGYDQYIDNPIGYEYNWIVTSEWEYYNQDPGFSNALDVTKYAGYFEHQYYYEETIKEKIANPDPRGVYYENWNGEESYSGPGDFDMALTGTVQDNVEESYYDYNYYIEVNGPVGSDRDILFQSLQGPYTSTAHVRARGVNLRYYELSDDLYWVLGSVWFRNTDEYEFDEKFFYICYKSNEGFKDKVEFDYDSSKNNGDVWRLHGLSTDDVLNIDGTQLFIDGSFRLFRRTTITEYNEKITKKEISIPLGG